MKRVFNWGAFLGCLLIAVSVLAAGFLIRGAMPEQTEAVSVLDAEYLTPEQAAQYLGLEPIDLVALDKTGAFEPRKVSVRIQGKTVYRRSELADWMNSQFVGE